jgi:hypothetical protein
MDFVTNVAARSVAMLVFVEYPAEGQIRQDARERCFCKTSTATPKTSSDTRTGMNSL